MKKAQAAMEFLMTYGWAILVVLVAIASIAYFGVMSPEKFLPERCVISPGSGLFCEQFSVSSGIIKLRIRNILTDEVEVTQASVSQKGNSCKLKDTVTIPADSFVDITLNQGTTCANLTMPGEKLKGDIDITFTKKSFPKTTTGGIVGIVLTDENETGGPTPCLGITECGNYTQAECANNTCNLNLPNGCQWNGSYCVEAVGACAGIVECANYSNQPDCDDNNCSVGGVWGCSWNVTCVVSAPPTLIFTLKNSDEENVASFFNSGDIILKRNCFAGTCSYPSDDLFVIQDPLGETVAYINSTGDLCIEDADCNDNDADCDSPGDGSFIVENTDSVVVSYIDATGNLCLIGNLMENGSP